MHVIHTIPEFRAWRTTLPATALTPFVPTMGALHEGHASLVRQARTLANTRQNSAVLASIFVNPTQFGPTEDFTQYPRTLEADLSLLQQNGATAVFFPSAAEMYPHLNTENSQLRAENSITIDPGPLATILEGAIRGGRTGHFRGVCTVVAKLLAITQPSHLLLGQKDFQQQAVLRQMCLDLNLPVQVLTCPTIREADGLAMSSRNRYLSAQDRPRATALYEALSAAATAINNGQHHAPTIDQLMHDHITARGLSVQYALAAHAQTLTPFSQTSSKQIAPPTVLLVAAKLPPPATTRLIDNLLL